MPLAHHRFQTQKPNTKPATSHLTPLSGFAAPLLPLTIQRALQDVNALTPGDIQQLQGRVGNQAVIQLMSRRSPIPQSHGTSKLEVGSASDHFEQEANRVSQQVSGSYTDRTAPVHRSLLPASPFQPMSIGPEGGVVDGDLQKQLQQSQSGGQILPSEVQRQVGKATGADFSSVRVHDDNNSHVLNTHLQAKAFTQGNHIFLGKNQSPHDVQLMAHELTHTVQQGAVQQTGMQPTDSVQRASDGVPQISQSDGTGKIRRKLSLDKENWSNAKQVKAPRSTTPGAVGDKLGAHPIFFLYDQKDKEGRPAQPTLVVKLVKDGAEQAMAAEMMAQLNMTGTPRTKVIPLQSKSGQKLDTVITGSQSTKGSKKSKTKTDTETPKNDKDFVVMEYIANVATMSGLEMGGMTDDEFRDLLHKMQESGFFYDLGRIHGADVYMGNEDRLSGRRMALKNIFFSKETGRALPLDLGMIAVGKKKATTQINQNLPSSMPGDEIKDWVNLSIEGSDGKRRYEAPRNLPVHGRRGAGSAMVDFRTGVIEKDVEGIFGRFKLTVAQDLGAAHVREQHGNTDSKIKIWNEEIDWTQALELFKAGVKAAIDHYTSLGSGFWQEKHANIKARFGGESTPYMSKRVFAIKDRYVTLIRAGYSDEQAQRHIRKEVEQGVDLPITDKWQKMQGTGERGKQFLGKERSKTPPKKGRIGLRPNARQLRKSGDESTSIQDDSISQEETSNSYVLDVDTLGQELDVFWKEMAPKVNLEEDV